MSDGRKYCQHIETGRIALKNRYMDSRWVDCDGPEGHTAAPAVETVQLTPPETTVVEDAPEAAIPLDTPTDDIVSELIGDVDYEQDAG